MEFDIHLRCNIISCRATLTSEAWVTACSHIFCLLCAQQAGLDVDLRSSNHQRLCPACETPLHNTDDAVQTNLNPSEDYKAVVLSGLGPTIIMECASRAMMFFHYQAGQEVRYQEMLVGQMANRYHNINSQLDRIIAEANTEIASYRDKLAASTNERKEVERKNIELVEAYKAKSHAHQKLQKVYNTIKSRVGAAAIKDAAAANLDHALMSGHGNDSPSMSRIPQRPAQAHTAASRSPFHPQSHGVGGSAIRPSWSSANIGQRQRAVPSPNAIVSGMNSAHHTIAQPTPTRQSLGRMDPNVNAGSAFVGQGLPAGAKFSRQSDGAVNYLGHGSMGRGFGNSVLDRR